MGEEYAKCPLCGMDVNPSDADEIEKTMDFDNKSCAACGRTFSEARREEGLTT